MLFLEVQSELRFIFFVEQYIEAWFAFPGSSTSSVNELLDVMAAHLKDYVYVVNIETPRGYIGANQYKFITRCPIFPQSAFPIPLGEIAMNG